MMNRRAFGWAVGLSVVGATAARGIGAKAPARVIKPKRLSEGDTVGLVLPASAEMSADDIAWGREQLEALGFKVRMGRHAYDRHGYFAGTDRDRAADVNRMFADDSIDGVVCYTG